MKLLLILSWAMYDLANQFFALNVVSLYFVRWLTLEKQKPDLFYSISFGISTFLVAVSAPVLGVISDKLCLRKPFLIYLTLLSVTFTILLGMSNVFFGLVFFVIANFGCQTAAVFYDSLLANIAPKNKVGMVSGLGKMFSYSGAILAAYLVKPVVLKSGYQAAFLPTGLLFLVFALPCLLFVKDKPCKGTGISFLYFLKKDQIVQIFKDLKATTQDSERYPGLSNFLKAAFFCLCAVNVVILFMSVYATRVFGLNEAQVINLITFSTFFAVIGSMFSGFLSDYFGHKRFLVIVFFLWGICFSLGAWIKNVSLYWLIGALTGTALGSTWVVARALAIKLVPADKIGEVFGLFNLVGYSSAIIGAFFWGLILLFLKQWGELGYRIALFSLNLFIFFAIISLLKVNDRRKLGYP